MKRIYLSLIILHSIVFSSDYKIEKKAFGLHFGLTNTKFVSKQFQGLSNNSLMFSGDIELTPKWKIGGSSGFDFKNHGFTYTQLRFNRCLLYTSDAADE